MYFQKMSWLTITFKDFAPFRKIVAQQVRRLPQKESARFSAVRQVEEAIGKSQRELTAGEAKSVRTERASGDEKVRRSRTGGKTVLLTLPAPEYAEDTSWELVSPVAT